MRDTARLHEPRQGRSKATDHGEYEGIFGELKRDANATVHKLRQVIDNDMGRVAGSLGDLTENVTSDNEGVFGPCKDVNETVESEDIVGPSHRRPTRLHRHPRKLAKETATYRHEQNSKRVLSKGGSVYGRNDVD